MSEAGTKQTCADIWYSILLTGSGPSKHLSALRWSVRLLPQRRDPCSEGRVRRWPWRTTARQSTLHDIVLYL